MLEFSDGLYWCWIVWAFKPGDLRVVALCTNEEKANQYITDCKSLFTDCKLYAEKAPMDHTFGASDLRSVAHRAAMRKYKVGD